ncbi:DNA-binding protein [Escherichia coli]|nr:DNA-binding protein [Escherichia coli]MCZ6066259.1 DNA-binding protein [Escherichia coli]
MTKLLNTYEQADFERLAAFYPYRDEHGLPVLEESLKDYAKRTNQTVNAVKRQADRAALPINQEEKTQNVQ